MDLILTDIKYMREMLARIDAKLDGKADKSDVVSVAARVDDRPTTFRTVQIALLCASLIVLGTLGGSYTLLKRAPVSQGVLSKSQ